MERNSSQDKDPKDPTGLENILPFLQALADNFKRKTSEAILPEKTEEQIQADGLLKDCFDRLEAWKNCVKAFHEKDRADRIRILNNANKEIHEIEYWRREDFIEESSNAIRSPSFEAADDATEPGLASPLSKKWKERNLLLKHFEKIQVLLKDKNGALDALKSIETILKSQHREVIHLSSRSDQPSPQQNAQLKLALENLRKLADLYHYLWSNELLLAFIKLTEVADLKKIH